MIQILLIEADPLLRALIADLVEQAQLRLAAAVASVDEAHAVLRADDRAPVEPLVLVVPVRRGYGRPYGGAALGGGGVPGADRSPPSPAGGGAGPVAVSRVAGVVYFGEGVSALPGEGLGLRERFLAVPFGQAALAAAVYGLVGRPVPRWLEPRRRVAQTGVPEAGR
jgi:hypothetical protein